MTTAQQRGWGNPDDPHYRSDHIISVRAGGVVLYIRAEIAHLVIGFCDEIVQRGYPLNVRADDWGYNNRDIRGRPGVKSNHAWGLAIDLNSATNPMTEDGHVHTDMPAWVPDTAAKYGLFWGGHYSGARKDPMHFEFLGTPADVARYPTETPQPQPLPQPHHQETDMFLVIGYDGGQALYYFYPQLGRKVTVPNQAALEEATKGAGFGGFQKMAKDDIDAIQFLNVSKNG